MNGATQPRATVREAGAYVKGSCWNFRIEEHGHKSKKNGRRG
jgi:hypothetical protein